jgi:hypothetical protein
LKAFRQLIEEVVYEDPFEKASNVDHPDKPFRSQIVQGGFIVRHRPDGRYWQGTAPNVYWSLDRKSAFVFYSHEAAQEFVNNKNRPDQFEVEPCG